MKCYICNGKLSGEQKIIYSSFLPYSKSVYSKKIADIIGEEYYCFVTNVDYLCKKCTSLLLHLDRTENEIKIVKESFLSFFKQKYGLFAFNNTHAETSNAIDGNNKINNLDLQKKIKTEQDNLENLLYKCSFCTFHTKEIERFSFHMRIHKNNNKGNYKQNKKRLANTLPIGKLYRCCACTATFKSNADCSNHIQNVHRHQTTGIEKKTLSDAAKNFKEKLLKLGNSNFQKNVHTNMLLSNNVLAIKQETNEVLPAQGQEKLEEIDLNDIQKEIEDDANFIDNLDLDAIFAEFQ